MEFQWDDGKRAKCLKHGVSGAEIEEMFLNGPFVTPDYRHSSSERRFHAFGLQNGQRYLFVTFTFRPREDVELIRPICARYMHSKEIGHYEKAIARLKN